jgi:hypothetical protein
MEANDTNGDGKIDLGDDVPYDTLVAFTDACDTDGNGTLDACEMYDC